MFTNRLFSRFFNNGQVIETVRGGGIFQPAVDKAIKLLQDGEWVKQYLVSGIRVAAYETDSCIPRRQDQSDNYQSTWRNDPIQVGSVSRSQL